MKHEERVARLEEHLKNHPTDYQAVVAHLKARSDLIEHKLYLKTIERKKRVAEVRRRRNAEKSEQHFRSRRGLGEGVRADGMLGDASEDTV